MVFNIIDLFIFEILSSALKFVTKDIFFLKEKKGMSLV